jgi:hypothetical protein
LHPSNTNINASCETFKDNGISQIRIYSINDNSFKGKYIQATINLIKLAGKENLMNYNITEKDKSIIENNFNDIMFDLVGDDSLDLKYWWSSRIDYCINIKTPFVDQYITLLQSGLIPQYFNLQYNENRHKAHRSGSYYISNDSLTVNFYNKEKERADKNAPQSEIDLAKDILRLEIQYKSRKLRTIKNKYQVKTRSILDFMISDIAQEEINSYIKKIVGTGRFYNLDQSYKIINKSHLQRRSKESLKKILSDIGMRHGLRYYIKSEQLDNNYKAMLKKLNDLNIAYVPIPRSWKIKDLDSLTDLVDDQFNIQVEEV